MGGKNDSLGEMHGALASQGVRGAERLRITAEGYRFNTLLEAGAYLVDQSNR